MVLLDLSVFPLDKGASVSPYVARCLDIIDRSGLEYRCYAMGTTIEGDFDQVMDVAKRCFQALAADCERIECSMHVDYRKGCTNRLVGKVASVEEKLGRKVKK
jgi:uncharacterized protein (TIGR00106 family)